MNSGVSEMLQNLQSNTQSTPQLQDGGRRKRRVSRKRKGRKRKGGTSLTNLMVPGGLLFANQLLKRKSRKSKRKSRKNT
tara:strand:- start:2017 stop:2253 length:237 start_codon:yes stop_codon:yes gene_type:complete